MFNFLRRKSSQEDIPQPTQQKEFDTAPGTNIHYDPMLVDELKDDHKALIETYTNIKAAFNEGDYTAVSLRLFELRTMLQGHLLSENVRFYIYLEHMLSEDEAKKKLIHAFRKEMDAIAKIAMNFLKKYEDISIEGELADAFIKDFNTIGSVLSGRIEKEESILYPLYMQAS